MKQQLVGNPKPIEGKITNVDGEDIVYLYEIGDPKWYTKVPEKIKRPAPFEVAQLMPDFCQHPSVRQRLIHIQPSKSEVIIQRADSLFALAARDALDLGIALHELFESISWIDEVDEAKLIVNWSGKSSIREDLKQHAVDLFRRAVAAPEIRKALTRPPGNVTLWQEKRFEIVIDKRWLSGVFDRVVVLHDQNGKAQRATVLDFKSDELPNDAAMTELAEHYRPQMELYRSALSRILGLDPVKIALKLLFVRLGKHYELR